MSTISKSTWQWLLALMAAATIGMAAVIYLAVSSAGVNSIGVEPEAGSTELVQVDTTASGDKFVEFMGDPIINTPLIIFDTDMGPDIDDALALSMLHSYQDLGEIEIAAVTVSRGSTNAARYIDALNTLRSRPNIPIGIYRGGTVSQDVANADRYTKLAANWQHDVHLSTIPDGFKVQRHVLARAEAEGREVIMVQTGFSGNISQLLNSGGDEHSSKSGIQLVRDNSPLLSIMAGNVTDNIPAIEFNIQKDISTARNLIAKWPTDMVVSDFWIGGRIFYPYYRGIRDKLPSNHIIRRSYENEILPWHLDLDPNDPADFYNMASWDLTSVMWAVEPDAGHFNISGTGTMQVDGNGRTSFNIGNGRHRILQRKSNSNPAINRMVELVK